MSCGFFVSGALVLCGFDKECPNFVSGCPNIDSGLSGKSCSLKIYKKRDVLKLSSRFNRGINMELQGRIVMHCLSGAVTVFRGVLSSSSFTGNFTARSAISGRYEVIHREK
ncbi:hypothetical protein [Aliikangiella coralliicola]|uniref:Uncharacterized protein n=1 Tax=Aliikangiella coralliicola TaxID=2592383 RepID=A0A545UGY1_9GAMM|nr:hypothetical protein [Aliikangiella coralliicola]TQV88663.1 hypothetical protein FLL46_09115 [Aliikangiella coralliicola]